MNTKEAIELTKSFESGLNNKYFKNEIDYFDSVIELLQRGEKYEKIFNTILNWTMHDGSFIPAKELINLEQKYFSKDDVIK